MHADGRSPGPGPARTTPRTGPSAWHLLWAVPVAVLVALALDLVAAISWCGISGCSGGGFGVTTDGRPLSVLLVLGSGLAVGAPVALVRWTGRRAARMAVAALVGAAWAGVVLALLLASD